MDGILKILKKENGPRASSAPALELNIQTCLSVYAADLRRAFTGPLVLWFVK